MEKPFSFVIIPDTQDVCTKYPERYLHMMHQIISHSTEWNIKKILHLGDLVNWGEDLSQWQNHEPVINLLENSEIPYLIAIGNHDYGKSTLPQRNSTAFNNFTNRYVNKSYVVSIYEKNKTENMCTRLEIDGYKFIFLALEFGPSDEVLAWANQILTQYEDHLALVITHSYLYTTGERTKPGDRHNPKNYREFTNTNDGEDIWHKCIKKHKNIIAVFSGHHIPENIAYRFDQGEKGNIIFQSFQNWQCAPYGGDGRFRLMTFDINNRCITLKTYNPNTDEFETLPGYELTIPFDHEMGIKHDLVSFSEIKELVK